MPFVRLKHLGVTIIPHCVICLHEKPDVHVGMRAKGRVRPVIRRRRRYCLEVGGGVCRDDDKSLIVPEAAGLSVSEKKTETMLPRTPDQTSRTPPLVTETAAKRHRHTIQLVYLGGVIHESADLLLEISRLIHLVWACRKRFRPELYEATIAPLAF